MNNPKNKTANPVRTSAASHEGKSVGSKPVLTPELTATSYKVEALEALIAGHLADAFEHITHAVRLYEENPSYTKRTTGHFHVLPELLEAYVRACERVETPAARAVIDLFSRIEELGQISIH